MKTKTPPCESGKRHRWKPCGGLAENPGIMGIGGTAIQETLRCARCEMLKTRIFGDINEYGNRNHGWRIEV